MTPGGSIAGAPFLQDRNLQRVLAVLNADGGEARVVGGSVRNVLLGLDPGDSDIATTLVPADVIERARGAHIKAVPTGIDHGTVTLVVGGKPFEVTTLRIDVETDGRRATVAFGTDWKADAERRDFTINALYADAEGRVWDYVGGLRDIETRTIRFIGEAEARIAEDYLRILRFFRFFAWYGEGRPDAEGIKACVRMKQGLSRLSAERVWSELKKLLAAPDPSRALLWMRQTGILQQVMPEDEKWGIDAIHDLIAAEREFGWQPDPLMRLEAIVPPDPARMAALAERLKLSKAERSRLLAWAMTPPVDHGMGDLAFDAALYRGDPQAIKDELRLSLAGARAAAHQDSQEMEKAAALSRLLDRAFAWRRPKFPVSGRDLARAGIPSGPEMGLLLKRLEDRWIDSHFRLDKAALLAGATGDDRG